MRWLKHLFTHPRLGDPRVPHPLAPRAEDTQIDLAAALTFALYAVEPRVHIGAHCARVAARVAWLARALEITGSELRTLVRAAELHEVGMVAVPVELLESPDPLSPAELARIRAQAWIGAEIVRKTESDLTAWLIQHQYTDYEALRSRLPPDSVELLLAGLFRVADVTDALAVPRPYQRSQPEHRRLDVLFSGMGTRFHPEAVRAVFEAGPPPE